MRGASASCTMNILSLRYRADGGDIDLPSQRVKGVQDQADRLVVGAAHDFPGVAVIIDMPPPGQRLVADAQAAPRRPFAQFAEILGGPIDAAEGIAATHSSR